MSLLEYVDRQNTDCAKWDGLKGAFGEEGLLPMWVADMDFRIDRHISDAMHDYISAGALGYYDIPDGYYGSFIEWEKREHGFEPEREWIRFTPGVVVGFHMALQIVTSPGDAVIVNTPVYYPFLKAIGSNGRVLVENELINDGGVYSIDFEDFEKKIEENSVRAFILCSPHNPVSRVWTEEELEKLLEICRKHDVTIISDEIHHDLIMSEREHVPTLSLAEADDRIIMLTAATKTFNIASVQNSLAIIPNDGLRAEWDTFTDGLRLKEGNALGYIATEAAYRYGKPWLEELKEIIKDNYSFMVSALKGSLEKTVISPLEGTYLAWIDLGAYVRPEDMEEFVQKKCRLAVDYGSWFGGSGSSTHIRVNLATSKENVREMTERLIAALK